MLAMAEVSIDTSTSKWKWKPRKAVKVRGKNGLCLKKVTDTTGKLITFGTGHQAASRNANLPGCDRQGIVKVVRCIRNALHKHLNAYCWYPHIPVLMLVCVHLILFVQTFQKDKKLREFFQVVSTNKDRKGKEFISTMEGMPILKSKHYCSSQVCLMWTTLYFASFEYLRTSIKN